MTETRRFDELTYWHQLQPVGFGMGWDPGWRPDGGAFADNIARADPYWGMVLDKAKAAYGDPSMHFNTADPTQDRYLVFGDGTRVPADGSLAYRDSANDRTYLLNDDGSVSPLGANGQAGQPIFPAGLRKTEDGSYAPVDPSGRQLAPLLDNPPPSPSGFHDQNGVLTPKNAQGDYYIDDPATGNRTYFDANGKPITEQQFKDGVNAAPPGPDGQGMPTDEQQSGRTADAVRKLQEELKDRYSNLSDAEGKLSEVLLNAKATTADGQQKLNEIQEKIVQAINNPALSLDTPAGEQAFLKFLRSQVAAIGDVLQSGTLTAEDQSKAIAALAGLYAADRGDPTEAAPGEEPGRQPTSPPDPGQPAPAVDPGAPVDLGPVEPMPDPTLSDLGLGGMGAPLGADPLSSLASTLPAAMGAFPPGAGLGGGSPLDALGGLAPLAGLASQLGDQARRDEPPAEDRAERTDENTDENDAENDADTKGKEQPEPDAAAQEPGQQRPPQPQPAGTPGEGAPQGAPAPAPPPPPTTVQLPDGSTANARTPELAQAVKAHLAGAPVQDAYRQAGIELPPPGTPVTNPVDPSRLSAGNLGMFKDHYVVALSSVKALQDVQVVPLSSVASSPDFLGWIDPTALGAATPAPAPPPPAPPPAPEPLVSPGG